MSISHERIALLDLGTNTFHLLIIELKEGDQWVALGKYKEPVKLGEGGFSKGKIIPDAYARAMQAMRNFQSVIKASGVTTVLAFATSAIRSAANGPQLVQDVLQETGIRIQIIHGNEEAALIHEGVKNGVRLPADKACLLLDIGGGSVEFIVSKNGEALLLRSINIGAARLLEQISPNDPITDAEWKSLQTYVHESCVGLLEELKAFDIDLLVGSSGTFETLAALAAHENKDHLSAEQLNGYRFSRELLQTMISRIRASDQDERMGMRGMDPLRVDMIVVGAGLVHWVAESLDIEACMVSSYALKDGMLFRHLREQRNRLSQLMGTSDRDMRAKAIQQLARKYHYDQAHSLQVGEIATQLFTELQPFHQADAHALELLQYSALLFNIGHYINASGHHKHGLYLIMNTALSGFSTNELVVIANIVRYHRKSLPKQDHFHFSILSERSQQLTLLLGGILRIAINLDQGRRRLIDRLEVEVSDSEVCIKLFAPESVDMEIGFAQTQSKLLAQALGKEIRITQSIS